MSVTTDLQGDLLSPPNPDRELWDEEVFALDYLLRSGKSPADEVNILRSIIYDRQEMLRAELLAAPPFLNDLIHSQVHHQLRARPDFRRSDLVVEQWMPSLSVWLICGRFPYDTPGAEIVRQLQAGDPRHKSAADAYEESRSVAAANRARHDAEGTEKVFTAINSLSSKSLDQFMSVEQALHTGETIVAHGSDLAFLESAHDKTRAAASRGDSVAQSVLQFGQSDSALCINPGDNPLIR